MSLIIDEHRGYLADAARVDCFRRALAEVVRLGDVVVDLGCGTGILGLLACACGAGRVYAVDNTGMVEIARALAAANGVADRMHVVRGHSSTVTLPEPADALVGDFLAGFGFEADLFELYPKAARRFLKAGGVVIPADISLFLAPVERPDMYEQVRFWQRAAGRIVLHPAFDWAVNTGYPVLLHRADLLADPVLFTTMPTTVVPGAIRSDVEAVVTREGMLHGIGGWFAARLSPGVTMTNSPLAAGRIHRRNVFLPVEPASPVAPGDRVRVRLRILPNDLFASWRVEVIDHSGAVRGRASHNTLRGMLISREDLLRERPDFVPDLNPRGQARLTTLQLCDGRRPLAEIERTVRERHPDLFSSPGEAAAFVAGVVARDGSAETGGPR